MKLIRAFMQFFFHHFYHRLSWTYDFVATIVSLGQWNGWVGAALEHIEGKYILELGFGPGYLQKALQQNGYFALGLDESGQMANRAARRLRQFKLTPKLVRGLAGALPYADGWCDTVVATFPTEYIYQEQTLAETWRVLKPGGLLVVLPMAWQARRNLLERGIDWLFRVTGQRADDSESFREKLASIFEKAGFRVKITLHPYKTSTLLFILARKQ